MATYLAVRDASGSDGLGSASTTSPSLFPTVPPLRDAQQQAPMPPEPAAKLVGIARLAASSPQAGAKCGTEYFLLPVQSILNRCNSERVPFPWTVNPYRGCEFGCHYCFARYTHEFMELDGSDFEHKIFVKQDAARLAARELLSKAGRGEQIAIGTATDPYQPAEREFGVTRSILEQMALHMGLNISITTKSDLIVRDLELLRRIAASSTLRINITVTTMRARLARLLEPRAPRPDLRMGAVRALREAGLAVGVLAMPIVPWLTDREEDLDALACAARDSDALWFASNVLYLMPTPRKAFFSFLEKKFPRLVRQYEQWYARTGYAPESYSRELGKRIAKLRQKYGLGARSMELLREEAPPAQLSLGLGPEDGPGEGSRRIKG
jgi:DNA repair photolyase